MKFDFGEYRSVLNVFFTSFMGVISMLFFSFFSSIILSPISIVIIQFFIVSVTLIKSKLEIIINGVFFSIFHNMLFMWILMPTEQYNFFMTMNFIFLTCLYIFNFYIMSKSISLSVAKKIAIMILCSGILIGYYASMVMVFGMKFI
ncbi:MAG: hypothetical protein ACTSPQ_18365 [Candidatus Helarchaeota archaeon]